MQFLVTLAAFVLAVAAQDSSLGSFITPPASGAIHDYSQNPTYQIGQQIMIQWTAVWKNVDLVLWQNDNPNPEILVQNKPNNGKLQWQITTNKNYSAQSGTNGTVFFLQIGSANGPNVFGSHYFNLTGPDTSSTASAGSSTTSIAVNNLVAGAPSTSTLSTVTRPTSSPKSSQSSSTASSSSPSLDSSTSPAAPAQSTSSTNVGLAAGLGVSLGLAIAGLIGAVAFILVRRRKQPKDEVGQMPGYGPGVGVTGAYAQPAPVEIMSGRRETYEFYNGATRVHEMSENGPDRPGVTAIGGVHEMAGQGRNTTL